MLSEQQAEMKMMKQEHHDEIAALNSKLELLEVKVATQERSDAKDDIPQQLELKQLQAGACVTSLNDKNSNCATWYCVVQTSATIKLHK